MSFTNRTDMESAQLQVQCPFCDSGALTWCYSMASGERAKDLHAARYDVMIEIVRLSGYMAEATALHHENARMRRALRELINSSEWGDESWVRIRLREVLYP